MESIRKPFQGVWNIIRFNWHFYALSLGFVLLIFWLNNFPTLRIFANILDFLIIATTIISLLVSYYVYDLSGLYNLNWMDNFVASENIRIININAGFDETSILLKRKFPDTNLLVFDFYDPSKHTEISIKRARKAYPPYPNTRQISTSNIPIQDNFADKIFVILAAHEIRDFEERTFFFKELKRILKQNGQIIITEHLRDLPNFLAYNIGFFHFIAKSSWYNSFKLANLKIYEEIKITPFVTTFILEKHGIAP
jgi:ubiquinone/menaquinone biosynthesis C-methylase UbiE